MFNSQFLNVFYSSVYHLILRRPFIAIVDIVSSSVNLKYHNLQGESAIISVDIKGEKRIYKVIQQDQEDCVAMEINMASLVGQL